MHTDKHLCHVAPRPRSSRKRRIEAERLLLASLCQQTLTPAIRDEVLRHLANHKFINGEYQLVFWALPQLPAREPSIIRDILATRLTLMGFPDFDINYFFETPPPAEREIPALLKTL